MKETGKVVAVEGDVAFLLFNRTSMCAKCGACGMTAGQNEITVSAQNSLHAKVGDRVEIQFTTKNALTSSLIAYIFPLIMLFIGLWLGYTIPQNFFKVQDVLAAILGIAFALGSFLVIKLLDPCFQKKFTNVYTMVRIAEDE